MLRAIRQVLARFRREEDGTLAIETVLIFPVLCWAYLATFIYFDAFRVQSQTLKAAYTISDQMSRETGYISPTYLKSLYKLHELLTFSNQPSTVRVSVVTFDGDTEQYHVRWSRWIQGGTIQSGSNYALTDTKIPDIEDQLPVMPSNEVVIVMENWLSYEPAFSVGLNAFNFQNLIVTRPRFNAAQVCWNDVDNGGPETATC